MRHYCRYDAVLNLVLYISMFIKDNTEPGEDIEKQTAENVNQEVLADEQSNEKKMEGDKEEPKP